MNYPMPASLRNIFVNINRPVLNSDVLDDIYDQNKRSVPRYDLDTTLMRTPVLELWKECTSLAYGKQLNTVYSRLITEVQDLTDFDPDVENSYGLRCLIQDISERGYSELPSPSQGTRYTVICVHITNAPNLQGVCVDIWLREVGSDECYQMSIRYQISSKTNVIRVLESRPIGSVEILRT